MATSKTFAVCDIDQRYVVRAQFANYDAACDMCGALNLDSGYRRYAVMAV